MIVLDEIYYHLMVNAETIITDIYTKMQPRLQHLGFFKGNDRELYLEGIDKLVREEVRDIISSHFSLNPEDMLSAMEDRDIKDFTEQIQLFVKMERTNEYKDTLH